MKKHFAFILALLLCITQASFSLSVTAAEDTVITSLTNPPERIRGITETTGITAPSSATGTNIEGLTLTPVWSGVNFTFGESLMGKGGTLLEYTAVYTADEGYTFSEELLSYENTALSENKRVLTFTLYTYVIPQNAIYIDDSGSDSTQDYAEGNYEKPYKTLGKAASALGGEGVIVIKEKVTAKGDFGSAGQNFVIVGWDESSTVSVPGSLYLKANVTFRDLTINYNTTPYIGIYGRGNKIVFGDEHYNDLTITSSDSVSRQFMATGDGGAFSGSDVTINSGTFDNIYLSGWNETTVVGDVNWTVNGGEIKNFYGGLHCGNSAKTHSITGNINITVTGGAFTNTFVFGNLGDNSSMVGDINVKIIGGSFKNIYGMGKATSPFDGNMSLTISGGEFIGAAGSIYPAYCKGSESSSYTVNYTDYTSDKASLLAKINTTSLTQILGPCYYVDSASGSDSNTGSSPAEALASMKTAFSKFTATVGGKIIICGDYEPKKSGFLDKVGRAKVIVTGLDENARLFFDQSLELKSETVFENLTFHVTAQYKSLRAVNCKLTLGEGLTTTYDATTGGTLQPAGTSYSGVNDGVDVTICSGEYGLTYAGELGGSRIDGDINWTLNGGSISRGSFILGSYCGEPKSEVNDASINGDINLTVNGGSISQSIFTANSYAPIAGDVNVVINGGNISGSVNLGAEKNTSITKTFDGVDYTYNPGIEGNVNVEINGGSISGKFSTKNRIEGVKVLVANNGIHPSVAESTFDWCIYSQPNGNVKAIIGEDGSVGFKITPNNSSLPIIIDGVEVEKAESGIYSLTKGVHSITYDKSIALSAAFYITPPQYGIKPITSVVKPGGANVFGSLGNCTASEITWTPKDAFFQYDKPYTAELTLSAEAEGITFTSDNLESGININSKNAGNTYSRFTATLNDDADKVTVTVYFDAIPTPTPENTSGVISGKFTTLRSGISVRNATVTLEDSSGVVSTLTATESGDSGSYSFSVPIGTYTLTVAKPGYLDYVYRNIHLTPGRNIELNAGILIPGDIDSDKRIGIEDFTAYLSAFAINASEKIREGADIFEDGIPTVSGLSVLKIGFGKSTEVNSTHDENSRTMAFANTRYKLEVEKKLTLGFIGGSITANSGNKYYGYDEQVYDKLRAEFPDAEISYVQAGISNTGSNFGIFRLESQLMRNTENIPDLVFLEYAVNDFNTFGQEHIEILMESLILNVYRINPNADIAIILTALSGYDVPRAAHIKVAEHYGIPVIDVGRPSGKLNAAVGDCKVTTNDNLHPNSDGYELYCKIITDRLLPYLKGEQGENELILEARTLPSRMATNCITNPRFISPTDSSVVRNGNWTVSTAAEKNTLSGVCAESGTKGDTMTFAFKGSSFGFIFRKGTNIGVMEYSIDGGEWRLFNANHHQQSYTHYQTYYIEDNIPLGEHTVSVRVSGYKYNNKARPVAEELSSSDTDINVGIAALLYNAVE